MVCNNQQFNKLSQMLKLFYSPTYKSNNRIFELLLVNIFWIAIKLQSLKSCYSYILQYI